MTIKYLKDVSTKLTVASAVREVDLNNINYTRHNTYQNIYIYIYIYINYWEVKNIAKDFITNGFGASRSGGSYNTIHWDLASQYLNKEMKGTVSPFRSGYIRHPYSNQIDKNLHIHSKMRTFHNWSRNRWRNCWWSFSCRGSWKQILWGFSLIEVSGG